MSFLDMDEWLVELAGRAELVYSPFMDAKDYPDGVDVVLVEGAVATTDHPPLIRAVRDRSRRLVSFGDCAVTGNVTALRNPLGVALAVLRPSSLENGDLNPQVPTADDVMPALLDRAVPVHELVAVDFYLPGCPPPAERIRSVVEALLDGREPVLAPEQRRFG